MRRALYSLSVAGLALAVACSKDNNSIVLPPPPPPPPPTVATVAVFPSSATIKIDSTFTLTDTMLDAAGLTVPGATATWSSSDTTIATVDTAGVVKGKAAGTATISATANGSTAKGSAVITVR